MGFKSPPREAMELQWEAQWSPQGPKATNEATHCGIKWHSKGGKRSQKSQMWDPPDPIYCDTWASLQGVGASGRGEACRSVALFSLWLTATSACRVPSALKLPIRSPFCTLTCTVTVHFRKGTIVPLLKGAYKNVKIAKRAKTCTGTSLLEPKCSFTTAPQGSAPMPLTIPSHPRGTPNSLKTHLRNHC